MLTHQRIDARSLALHEAIAAKIDADPGRRGLAEARANCQRWLRQHSTPAHEEWAAILENDWEQVRAVLLQESEEGQRLRQSSPFAGILSTTERLAILADYARDAN